MCMLQNYKAQYKFGVLYARAGQTTETQFLNNGNVSIAECVMCQG